MRQIGDIMPFSRDSLVANMEKGRLRKEGRDEPPKEEEEEQRPQRASMADFFSTYQPGTTLKSNRWE